MTRTPPSTGPLDIGPHEIDAELSALQPVIAGDRRARAAFVERFARLVYAVVGRTIGRARQQRDDGLVEEVFTDVFVALFDREARRLRQWAGRCSLASWVRLVASSVALDALRRLRDAPSLVQIESLAEEPRWDGEDPIAALLHAEEPRRLAERWSGCPRRMGSCSTALYLDDLAPGVIAARLGIAPGALYTRKNRALERLRTAMDESGGGEL